MWPVWLVAGIVVAALILFAIGYWHLVIAEGAYLGPGLVAWLYDRVARRYDQIKAFDWEDEAYFVARPIRMALDLVGIDRPLILDVATGTGRVARALLFTGDLPGMLIGLDRSLAMLKEARAHVRHRSVTWLWQDASHLPFDDRTFDVVTCLEALEFFPSPAAVLEEMVRVLKPGGFLLISNRIGWEAHLLPGRTFDEEELGKRLEHLGMASWDVQRWQVDYDWVMARKGGELTAADRQALDLAEILRCPACGKRRWSEAEDRWDCLECGRSYRWECGILYLLQPALQASNHRD